ncbi:hypothetical protein NB231_01249 [Nitrococcus mobilis Nb-231]|uniref:Transposase n=1 Tax=Nitrococcus mobilis Nb-231 TaxID=314278 RepID=A4BS15_9GAMM|nr:hypothetical protein NB231_01249 [Nitrococcus mobilis Nb-231]
MVVADKPYDADAFLSNIERSGVTTVIPPRTNRRDQRCFDRHRYRDRNLVERFSVA